MNKDRKDRFSMSQFRECQRCGAALDPGERCDCGDTENSPALCCTQLPVIADNLDSVQQNLTQLLSKVSALPQDDESLKYVKQLRANLTKEFDQMEAQRKAVKQQVMDPYNQKEKKYKAYIEGPYRAADQTLKAWVDSYQNGLKQKCEDDLRAYFAECCQDLCIDFLSFEDCGVAVDMALARQKEPRKAMLQIFDYVTAVRRDLDVIATLEDSSEVLAEYRRCKSLNGAIVEITDRKQAKAEAKAFLEERQAWQETQERNRAELVAAAPEIAQPEEVYTVAFLAKGTMTALKAMKAHALCLGITFEEIKQEDENDE